MPTNSEEIIDAVKQVLSLGFTANNTRGWTNPEWTKAVKSKLCRLGRDQFRCQVHARDVDITDGGGLLRRSVTWLQRNGDDDLIDASLVAECEWGRQSDIEKDFEKLLLACAQVRVMIYRVINRDSERIIPSLAWKIRQFRRSGGGNAWLLAGVIQKEGNFFKRWYFNDLQ